MTANFCDDFPEFNDQMSEIVVESTNVTGDSDGNQDGADSGFQLDTSAAIAYCKDKWGYSTEQCQELVDYAVSKIITNETWMQGEMEKAEENDRSLNDQVMHAANWQLYKKEGCKYCDGDSTGSIVPAPAQKAGLGTVPMIVIGVAVLGVAYLIYRKVSSSPK